MKKKIEKFIEALTELTNKTGLWIDPVSLNEAGGFIRYNFELEKYEFIKEK